MKKYSDIFFTLSTKIGHQMCIATVVFIVPRCTGEFISFDIDHTDKDF